MSAANLTNGVTPPTPNSTVDIFKKVADSYSNVSGHTYLVIDSNNQVSASEEKVFNFKQITELVNNTLSDKTLSESEINSLVHSYTVIKEKYESKELGLFTRLFRSDLVQEKKDNLAEANKLLLDKTVATLKSTLTNFKMDDLNQKHYDVARSNYTGNDVPAEISDGVDDKGQALQGIRHGGRTAGWVKATFGMSETQIKKEIATNLEEGKITPPKAYTVSEINQTLQMTGAKPIISPSPQVKFNFGTSANDSSLKWKKNAIAQGASQFNFQEAKDSRAIPSVENYRSDPTQGPQLALEGAYGSILRQVAEENKMLPHALSKCFPEGNPLLDKCYKNGYLEIDLLNDKEKQTFKSELLKNIDKLAILPQNVMCERTGQSQLQVFTAAPSFQSSHIPKPGTVENDICQILMVAQYKAIAQLAVIRSRETGESVPLHLTLVGQGAFRNNPIVMGEVYKAVMDVVKNENVEVNFEIFNSHTHDQFVKGLEEAGVDVSDIPNFPIDYKALFQSHQDQLKTDYEKTTFKKEVIRNAKEEAEEGSLSPSFIKDIQRDFVVSLSSGEKTEALDATKPSEVIKKKETLNKLSYIAGQTSVIQATRVLSVKGYKALATDNNEQLKDIPTLVKIREEKDGSFTVTNTSIQLLANKLKGSERVFSLVNLSITISAEVADELNKTGVLLEDALNHPGIEFQLQFSPHTDAKAAVEEFFEMNKDDAFAINQIANYQEKRDIQTLKESVLWQPRGLMEAAMNKEFEFGYKRIKGYKVVLEKMFDSIVSEGTPKEEVLPRLMKTNEYNRYVGINNLFKSLQVKKMSQ